MSSSAQHTLRIQSDVLLSDLTTIHLGGRARYFAACRAIDDIREALAFARGKSIRVCVLGGGSNVLFADEGFDGLVIHIETRGISAQDDEDAIMITAAAGEEWDPFIERCIEKGLGGIECLSGIPGLVGATPIQNVGAYGQEVCDTIVSVRALDRETLDVVELPNRDCGFGYRQSRFKSADADRFVITDVKFRLRKHGRPEIRYPELQKFITSTLDLNSLPDGEPVFRAVREAVITLRRRKSMVIDPRDPNSRSVGSFFMNPVLTKEQYAEVQTRWVNAGGVGTVPTFPSGERIKIPAAWLVENAGFQKGYRSGGVGVSLNHSLALVNFGGTTREIIDLAGQIQRTVYEGFGVGLQREPVIVPA